MDLPACARCGVKSGEKACRQEEGKGPVFCPTKGHRETVEAGKGRYGDPGLREFARQASLQEAECYINRGPDQKARHPAKTRLEEICEFAGKMGYRRLGLAYCAGLQPEAAALDRVLGTRGFEVVSVVCKVGCVPKEELGIADHEKVHVGQFESMCNPVTQAGILNQEKTEFNILLGLCVGHDSLFLMHSKAPATVFAVKDRVLGHNPIAALYTLDTYYERLKGE